MDTGFSKKHLSHFYGKVWLFLIPYLVIFIGCCIVKMVWTREQIYFFINGLNTTWGDTIFPFFTMLGDGLTVVILGLIIALFNYRKSFLLLTSYGLTALVAQVFKFIFDMPRPYLYFKDHSHIHYVKGIYMLSYHSFPSGHTVTAFSACMTLAYLFKNNKLDLLMLLLACCIGYSRMYLSEHFFEDVMAGSCIGVFTTLFWLYYLDNRQFLYRGKWREGVLRKVG